MNDEGRKTWIVAFFNPSGNVEGRFNDNVYPPTIAKRVTKRFHRLTMDQAIDHSKEYYPSLVQTQTARTTEKIEFNLQNYMEVCLKSHNRYRKVHGCPPLKLVDNLNKYAAEWAEVRRKFMATLLQVFSNFSEHCNAKCAGASANVQIW